MISPQICCIFDHGDSRFAKMNRPVRILRRKNPPELAITTPRRNILGAWVQKRNERRCLLVPSVDGCSYI
jgi:hypothetical protein